MMRDSEAQGDLNELRCQLGALERERDRALQELREVKRKTDKSNASASDRGKIQELNSVKESLLNANKELRIKDRNIDSLRSEVCQMKQLELRLEEKDASMQMMKDELNNLKSSMALTESLLSDTKKRVAELEAEVSRRKESEAKLLDSFATQTHQLEEASILLEKSNLEISALHEKMQEMEEEYRQKYEAATEVIDRLGNELQLARENWNLANNKGQSASVEAETFFDDTEVLKNELKRAMQAEDNSKKAMDDFALALKEVTAGSNHNKEKLIATEQQLEAVTEEAANLKKIVKFTEETCEAIVTDLKMERDRLKNTVKRLSVEAEESLLAWNEKEVEFVNCIKQAEDEKIALLKENSQLTESMREAEEISNKLKDEIKKLRDILKQAVNEANVAKEAANIARAENSYLKDFIAEKDKALVSLAQENECLRINEVEEKDNMKELKRLIRMGLKKEIAKLDKESKEQRKAAKKESSADSNDRESKEGRKLSSTFSFDLNQFWPGTPKSNKDVEEDPESDDALGGSIFDILESPADGGDTPPHPRGTSSAGTDDSTCLNSENLDDAEHFDDDIDKSPQGKRKALIRRFGDLLRRKKFSPTQGSISKDLPQSQKEITV